ncbi:MAG: tRNA uridine-5-carboxymethylaminomethyl(34) synthesis GTPase MnmE [Pseudomonadota bacterium]
MLIDTDTVAAVATAAGRGGIGVVRISGPKAITIAKAMTQSELAPRYAQLRTFHNLAGEAIDKGIALVFESPNSFTGEDVAELHAHGSPVVLDLLVREACLLGARAARPGEFSQRAYLNGKLDLAQAEAIADLINSSTEQAALNATRSLSGAFSKEIKNLIEMVTNLRVYVEAAIDFPEEEIDFIEEGEVADKLSRIVRQLELIKEKARHGSLVQEGMKLVIAGKPNAGKSSLLNTLAGSDKAIVTSVAGTTRDVLREQIQIEGMPIHVFDTAGLRESKDAIEQEGVRRAKHEIASADRVLWVVDDNSDIQARSGSAVVKKDYGLPDNIPVTIVRNKCDLSGSRPALEESSGTVSVVLSAKTGAGLDLLRTHLKASAGLKQSGEGAFSARRRHLLALTAAADFLKQGQRQLHLGSSGELLAEDLREAQKQLGEITGDVSSDQLLGKIFSSFCIGK